MVYTNSQYTHIITSNGDGLVNGINVSTLCFIDLDLPVLMPCYEASGLDNRTNIDGAYRTTG
jgi:hypothetical protein